MNKRQNKVQHHSAHHAVNSRKSVIFPPSPRMSTILFCGWLILHNCSLVVIATSAVATSVPVVPTAQHGQPHIGTSSADHAPGDYPVHDVDVDDASLSFGAATATASSSSLPILLFGRTTTSTTTANSRRFLSWLHQDTRMSNSRDSSTSSSGGVYSSSSSSSSQSVDNHGRTVLTFLYLCILGLCFLTPILYYCRLYFDERNARRMRQLEISALTTALEQSHGGIAGGHPLHHHPHLHHHLHNHNNSNREEVRAVRRKYVEERRARILQLFEPVRMVRISFVLFYRPFCLK
jgi:hypothetical protein